MTKFLMLSLLGCPAVLETKDNLSTDTTANEEIIPTQFGIIDTDNCDQETIHALKVNGVKNKKIWIFY